MKCNPLLEAESPDLLNQAMRFSGIPPAQQDLKSQMQLLARTLKPYMHPAAVWKVFDLENTEDGIRLKNTDIILKGHTAQTVLKDCRQAAVFGVTLGMSFDKKLGVLQHQNMADAIMADAIGSAAVEACCDWMEKEIFFRFPGKYLTDRFSCGYGDLPLSLQPDIARLLDLSGQAGIYVLPSFMMNPTKSVTAFIGLADKPQRALITGCDYCAFRENCAFRKRGERCETI